MRCTICGLSEDQTMLFDGITSEGMKKVCQKCSENEGVPLMKKPTPEQIQVAEQRYSVRERMEKMSGMDKPPKLSVDQSLVHKNLAKLKMPPKKQLDDKLLDNYYWKINMARRRRKMTINQLAQETELPIEIIESLEKGILPKNFEEPIMKLEQTLNTRLMKSRETKISFTRQAPNMQKKILSEVRERMDNPVDELLEDVENQEQDSREIQRSEEEKQKIKSRISQGDIDFSKPDQIQDITLSDLQDMKKQKDQQKQEVELKKQNQAMFGDDIDLDINEV
jgi:ribosome-binding protein aMBF1 (putative translation factor)